MHYRSALLTVVAALSLALVGTGTAASLTATKAPKTTKVPVGLQEFDVTLRPAKLNAGKVAFAVKNTGGVDHEFVVVRLGSPTAQLPLLPDGSVDESQIPAGDKLGDISALSSKKSKTLTVTFTPGTYQLFCNLVDHQPDGRILSHYKLGMHANLTIR